MIKADSFGHLFSDEEKQAIRTKEAEIDKLLIDGKGVAKLNVGTEFDPRIFNELVKRYDDAGWHSKLDYEKDVEQYVFTIAHPRLDLVFRWE